VGRFFGVPIYFAPSWLIIALVITVSYASVITDALDNVSTTQSYVIAFVFAVLLALSVLAHELGHVAVSLILKLRVRRVVIFLLGGVSEIEGEPRRARDEFVIAAAGPGVSVVLGAGCWGGYQFTDNGSVLDLMLFLVAWSNIGLAIFNLLPGLPLDGGRIVRSGIWALSHSQGTGTRVASWAGRVIAVGVVVATLALGMATEVDAISVAFSVLIALFIWSGASQSLRAVQVQDRSASLDLTQLMRGVVAVPADLPLSEALRRSSDQYGNSMAGLLVVDSDLRPRALVDSRRVAAVPPQQRPWVQVADVARPLQQGMILPDSLRGTALLDAFRQHPAQEYLIVRADGQPAGILNAHEIARVLSGERRATTHSTVKGTT
jgi:Zn-dependent protease